MSTQDLPWYVKSPSPWSIAIWVILIYLGYRRIKKSGHDQWYKEKYRTITTLASSALFLAIPVLMTDLMWSTASLFKWMHLFPESINSQVMVLGRDIAGLILCHLLVYDLFQMKIVHWSWEIWPSYLANAFFLIIWFGVAPHPALTDWTYAIRYSYPLKDVVSSFVISHVLGRVMLFGIWSYHWRKQINVH